MHISNEAVSASGLEALQKAGMDWTVSKKPALYNGQETGHYFVVREDKDEPLGVVGESYRPFQNRSLAALIDATFGESIEEKRAAMFGDGQRVFIQCKLPGGEDIGGGDDLLPYFLATSTHDGSAALSLLLTPIRVICQNTLQMAIRLGHGNEDSHMQNIRHTASMAIRLGAARENLAFLNARFSDFCTEAKAMRGVRMDVSGLETLARNSSLLPAKGELGGKAKGILADLSQLFEAGQGQNIPGVRGTVWAGLNAITEYVDHARATKGDDKDQARQASAYFGSGSRIKSMALDQARTLIGA